MTTKSNLPSAIDYTKEQHVYTGGLDSLVTSMIREGCDAVLITRISYNPRRDQPLATYRVRGGSHRGLKLDEAAKIFGMTLLGAYYKPEGVGTAVHVLILGKTLYAKEVLCLGYPSDKTYGILVPKDCTSKV